MVLKIKTPKLIVNHLRLVGHRKNYDVTFSSGINIVYGDTDTGKSSILNLVDYCLGASKVALYSEIEIAGKYCLLEVELSGEIFTIKRELFNVKKDVEVYRSSFLEIEDLFPKYYSPNYSREGADGYFSDFLLSNMNIPITKIKQSPSKEDSKMVRLSFRDINKFIFLNQDQVGIKKVFGDNYQRISKLKEAFKLMNNVLDTQISELENAISEKTNERNELNKKNLSISSFLNETKIDSLKGLEEKKEDNENEINVLEQKIESIDIEIISNNEGFNNLREEIFSIEKRINYLQEEKSIREQEFKQNISLRNEYRNDIKKMIATLDVLDKLPKIEDKETQCPVCDQKMMLSALKNHLINTDPEIIKSELNGVRRRERDLEKIDIKLRGQIKKNENEIEELTEKLDELRISFDKQTKNVVTPFISQRDSLTTRIGNLQSDLKNLRHFYKIRKQQSTIESEIIAVENTISAFRDDLNSLKKSAPTLDKVFVKLRDGLKEFLDFIGVKNVHGVSISDTTYLPVIRNKNYEDITSGGVRTLTSVGYFISLLEYAISNPVNYPSFLMVDTIAKYIGKTDDRYNQETNVDADSAEGMNDSKKYENIYKYLLKLNKRSSESFQMIIVDNDIPNGLADELQPYIKKHFITNSSNSESEIGFIDDAKGYSTLIIENEFSTDINFIDNIMQTGDKFEEEDEDEDEVPF